MARVGAGCGMAGKRRREGSLPVLRGPVSPLPRLLRLASAVQLGPPCPRPLREGRPGSLLLSPERRCRVLCEAPSPLSRDLACLPVCGARELVDAVSSKLGVALRNGVAASRLRSTIQRPREESWALTNREFGELGMVAPDWSVLFLVQLKQAFKPSLPVANQLAVELQSLFVSTLTCLGFFLVLGRQTLCVLRHSGPSPAAWEAWRSLTKVQLRGRWEVRPAPGGIAKKAASQKG